MWFVTPGGYLSLSNNTLNLLLVIVRYYPTVFQIRVRSNIVSRVYDKKYPDFPKIYRRDRLDSASSFYRRLIFVNEHIIVLNKDVEYEKIRIFIAVYGLNSLIIILRI
jgi:hypothetical protein